MIKALQPFLSKEPILDYVPKKKTMKKMIQEG